MSSGPDPRIGLEVEGGGDRVTVRLRGEIDLCTVPGLRARLDGLMGADGLGAVVVDMAELDFMDATGLEVLVQAQRRARARGAQVVLADPPAIVCRLLAVTGLDADFPVERAGGDRPARP